MYLWNGVSYIYIHNVMHLWNGVSVVYTCIFEMVFLLCIQCHASLKWCLLYKKWHASLKWSFCYIYNVMQLWNYVSVIYTMSCILKCYFCYRHNVMHLWSGVSAVYTCIFEMAFLLYIQCHASLNWCFYCIYSAMTYIFEMVFLLYIHYVWNGVSAVYTCILEWCVWYIYKVMHLWNGVSVIYNVRQCLLH